MVLDVKDPELTSGDSFASSVLKHEESWVKRQAAHMYVLSSLSAYFSCVSVALYSHVYGCTFVHVWGGAYAWMESREEPWVVPQGTIYFVVLRHGLSLV